MSRGLSNSMVVGEVVVVAVVVVVVVVEGGEETGEVDFFESRPSTGEGE